jgi:hypothetical protein
MLSSDVRRLCSESVLVRCEGYFRNGLPLGVRRRLAAPHPRTLALYCPHVLNSFLYETQCIHFLGRPCKGMDFFLPY